MNQNALLVELFGHLRAALDTLEQILVQPHKSVVQKKTERLTAESSSEASLPSDFGRLQKLSYTLKQARELTGVGRSTLYYAMRAGDLRAVKLGKKTLILAEDLHDWLVRLSE